MATIQFTYNPNAKPDETPRGSYEPTPPGVHDIKILSVEQQPPKPGKEHGQLAVKYEVVGSDDSTAIGRSRTFWLALSPKATPHFLVRLLQASGIQFHQQQIQTATGLQPALSFDPDHLIGVIVKAKCTHTKGSSDPSKIFEDWGDFSVSHMNPLMAGNPAAPAIQPQGQPAQGYAQPAAYQPPVQGYVPPQAAMPQPQPGFVPHGQPAVQGQLPPRRFG
jgi:hypothetical protein